MKKIYTFLAILSVPVILLTYSFTSGSPGGKTGSPMDNANCTQCHSGAANSIDNWISSDIPEQGFTAGETYTITLNAMDQDALKFGFELTAEGDESKVGTFTITEPARTKLVSDDAAITHTSGGTEPTGNEITWEFNWTAPDPAPTTITFYAAVNAANGNGQNSGDKIYLTSHSYNQFFVGLADHSLQDRVAVYPNPATSFANVNVPANAELRVVDMTGKVVLNRSNTFETETLELTNLANGMYFVQVIHNSETATIKLLKK